MKQNKRANWVKYMRRISKTQKFDGLTNSRRGTALIVVMICLMLVTAVMSSMLKSTLLQRKQMLQEQFRLQAEWLLESALERAVLQRSIDSKYQGETWHISPVDLGTRYQGIAEITLKTKENNPRLLSIQAHVKYPENTPFSVSRTKKIVL